VKEGEDAARKYGVALDWHSLDEYFRHFARVRPTINLGTFVGAGGIRNYVIGEDNRAATAEELERMKQLVAQAMEQGAFGVSSALQYVPDVYASTDEVVELAKVAHRYGGVYFTHQRSESDRIFESLDEVFAISARAEIPTTIWHLKAAYNENWGKMPEVLRRIEDARARGVNVAASVYPYTRASNGLIACFPSWVAEGGTEKMIARLKDPVQRARAKKEMEEPSATWENQWRGSGGAAGIQLIQVVNPALSKYEGMTLEEIARTMGEDPRAVSYTHLDVYKRQETGSGRRKVACGPTTPCSATFACPWDGPCTLARRKLRPMPNGSDAAFLRKINFIAPPTGPRKARKNAAIPGVTHRPTSCMAISISAIGIPRRLARTLPAPARLASTIWSATAGNGRAPFSRLLKASNPVPFTPVTPRTFLMASIL